MNAPVHVRALYFSNNTCCAQVSKTSTSLTSYTRTHSEQIHQCNNTSVTQREVEDPNEVVMNRGQRARGDWAEKGQGRERGVDPLWAQGDKRSTGE